MITKILFIYYKIFILARVGNNIINESVEKDYNDMCKNKLHILNKQLDHHMFTRPILTIYRITFYHVFKIYFNYYFYKFYYNSLYCTQDYLDSIPWPLKAFGLDQKLSILAPG